MKYISALKVIAFNYKLDMTINHVIEKLRRHVIYCVF